MARAPVHPLIRTTFDPAADILHVVFEAPDAVYDASEEVSPAVTREIDRIDDPSQSMERIWTRAA
jgi:hypothetical protein